MSSGKGIHVLERLDFRVERGLGFQGILCTRSLIVPPLNELLRPVNRDEGTRSSRPRWTGKLAGSGNASDLEDRAGRSQQGSLHDCGLEMSIEEAWSLIPRFSR